MATELFADLEAFNQFAREHLIGEQSGLSLEEGLSAYRGYQESLDRFKSDIQPALDELDSGRGTLLDIEQIIAEGRRRLAAEGIVD